MKHTVRFLVCGLMAAAPLLLLSGCYTQMGTARGDSGEDYDSQTAANDQTSADSTQPGDYDTARREFYNESSYPEYYPVYGAAIGFGWGAPWYGCSYPWGIYDPWSWYGGFYPYGYWGAGYHGGRYYAGGGYYYGRGYATRRFGMVRSGGGSRGVSAGLPGGYGRSPLPATRTGRVVAPGRTAGRGGVVSGSYLSRGRAGIATSRNRPGSRGLAARSAPSGTRSSGRGYSAPAGHAPSGGGSRGGGGGSRGGGGGSHGGGGRR
jgi:hypothetical protein